MRHSITLVFVLSTLLNGLFAQEDLLALLGEDEPVTNFVTAAFKTDRVVNLHSLTTTGKGVMDIKISHRFGFINGGISELFGLDVSTIRIGADFGISKRLSFGFGRSNFEKTYDGFLKYKFLQQRTGARKMPFTAILFASTAIKTTPFQDPDRENLFSSRLYYTFQLIIGSKVSDGFSFQLSPTVVHRNLVGTTTEENDVLALGIAARQKLSKRVSLNLEYIYVLPDQLAPGFRDSFSVGFDIETGGHVFQLHFTNSTSMIEKGFITETIGDWANGDVHFGFNVARVFSLGNPKGKKKKSRN